MVELELMPMVEPLHAEGLDYTDMYSEFEDDGDNCSVFSIETCTSGSSIAHSHSDLADYYFEGGRRYQPPRDGSWMLPNDEQEQDRYQIIDQMISLCLDGALHLAPLEQPSRILDLGTGTGVWAIDMAHKFPNARVIGTDISPIQVDAPVNCTFEIEDADKEWKFPPNYFSMIHSRYLMGGVTDWPKLFGQAYRALHPGGWMELQENPRNIYSDNPNTPIAELALTQFIMRFCDGFSRLGRICGEEIYEFKDHMKAAGFVDIAETRYRLPIGGWPTDPIEREIGRYNVLNFLEGVEGYTLALSSPDIGMDPVEARDLAQRAEQDMLNRRLQLYACLVVLRGRKPTAHEIL